jgi:hypothetical protein
MRAAALADLQYLSGSIAWSDWWEVDAMIRAAVVAIATLAAFDLLMFDGRHTSVAMRMLSLILRSYGLA